MYVITQTTVERVRVYISSVHIHTYVRTPKCVLLCVCVYPPLSISQTYIALISTTFMLFGWIGCLIIPSEACLEVYQPRQQQQQQQHEGGRTLGGIWSSFLYTLSVFQG